MVHRHMTHISHISYGVLDDDGSGEHHTSTTTTTTTTTGSRCRRERASSRVTSRAWKTNKLIKINQVSTCTRQADVLVMYSRARCCCCVHMYIQTYTNTSTKTGALETCSRARDHFAREQQTSKHIEKRACALLCDYAVACADPAHH